MPWTAYIFIGVVQRVVSQSLFMSALPLCGACSCSHAASADRCLINTAIEQPSQRAQTLSKQCTCLEVSLVRTISSRGMMCAGLKKWAPTILSAAFVFFPIKEMSMVEVLEDNIHSAEQAFSRSAKICCLMGMFSTAASITCNQHTALQNCPRFALLSLLSANILSQVDHCPYLAERK